MYLFLWVLSVVFFAIGFVTILGNVFTLVRGLRGRISGSQIPFIGGLMASFGMLASPLPFISSIWYLTLFLDPGCIWLIVASFYYWGRKSGRN